MQIRDSGTVPGRTRPRGKKEAQVRASLEAAGFSPDPNAPYLGVSRVLAGTWQTCGHRDKVAPDHVSRGCRECREGHAHTSTKTPYAGARRLMGAAGFSPDPDEPYPGSDKPWNGTWTDCGHRRPARLDRVMKGSRCGACRGNKLSEAEARARMEGAGFRPYPDVPYRRALDPWPGTWIECGHRSKERWSDLSQGKRCSICREIRALEKAVARAKSRAEQARLAPDTMARAAMANAGFVPDPDAPFPGPNIPWLGTWIDCGHRRKERVDKVEAGKRCGRASCRAEASLPAFRAMEAAGFLPYADAPYPGPERPWRGVWMSCGHINSMHLIKVLEGARCRECTRIQAREARTRLSLEAKGFVADEQQPKTLGIAAGQFWGAWVGCCHQSLESIRDVMAGGCCPTCQVMLSGLRSMARTFAVEAAGFILKEDSWFIEPDSQLAGTWLTCGHDTDESARDVQRGRGCSACAEELRIESDKRRAEVRKRRQVTGSKNRRQMNRRKTDRISGSATAYGHVTSVDEKSNSWRFVAVVTCSCGYSKRVEVRPTIPKEVRKQPYDSGWVSVLEQWAWVSVIAEMDFQDAVEAAVRTHLWVPLSEWESG